MSNETPRKIVDVLKSLWRAENALRKAALNGIVLRKPAASAHLGEARRHFDDAVGAFRNNEPPSQPPTISQ